MIIFSYAFLSGAMPARLRHVLPGKIGICEMMKPYNMRYSCIVLFPRHLMSLSLKVVTVAALIKKSSLNVCKKKSHSQ